MMGASVIRTMVSAAAVSLVAVAVPGGAAAGDCVTGKVHVVDGDTIRVGGQKYDIAGVTVTDHERARRLLRTLTPGPVTVCVRNNPTWGNPEADVQAGHVDVGEAMRRQGAAEDPDPWWKDDEEWP